MKNSLINTNKYLKNKSKRKEMIINFAYNCGKSEGLLITFEETKKIYEVLNKKA